MAIDLADKTANGNTLTNVNGAESGDTPFANSITSVDLEASSSAYLSASDSASLSITGSLTLENWVKFESLPTSGNLMVFQAKWLETGNVRSYHFSLNNDSGTLKFFTNYSPDGSAGNIAQVAWTPSTGVWYHVACVIDVSGPTVAFFVNGAAQGSAVSTSDTSVFNGTQVFSIGAYNIADGGANFLDGLIDECRVWNVARTQTQIDNNKSIQLTGSETNLVAYWPFNALTASSAGGSFLTNFV